MFEIESDAFVILAHQVGVTKSEEESLFVEVPEIGTGEVVHVHPVEYVIKCTATDAFVHQYVMAIACASGADVVVVTVVTDAAVCLQVMSDSYTVSDLFAVGEGAAGLASCARLYEHVTANAIRMQMSDDSRTVSDDIGSPSDEGVCANAQYIASGVGVSVIGSVGDSSGDIVKAITDIDHSGVCEQACDPNHESCYCGCKIERETDVNGASIGMLKKAHCGITDSAYGRKGVIGIECEMASPVNKGADNKIAFATSRDEDDAVGNYGVITGYACDEQSPHSVRCGSD